MSDHAMCTEIRAFQLVPSTYVDLEQIDVQVAVMGLVWTLRRG